MKLKKIITLFVWLLLRLVMVNQNSFADESQTISPKTLDQIEKAVTIDVQMRAMINAVSNNEIKSLALNKKVLEDLDPYFAYRIKTGNVTNQKSSGRCWLFTSLNVLRPSVMKKYYMKNFEFSENYLFFWDQLEKSNRFLETVLNSLDKKMDDRFIDWLFRNPIDDGGVWNMMVSLIKKYGAVPREVMMESYNSDNTRMVNRLLARKLREGGYQIRKMYKEGKNIEQLRNYKLSVLTDAYRMLVISLGEPPKEFSWRYEDTEGNIHPEKKYTPLSFYKEFVQTELEDYVMMMNDPSREYYKLYEIELDRNVYEGPNWTYVNLPAEVLKKFAKRSILSDEPIYFSCDVGKQLNSDKGYLALGLYDYDSMFGVKFGMDKKARISTFDSGSTHGMALMGVDTTQTGQTTKWLLENSWGKEKGYEGYLIMTDDWFDAYSFRLVVHKRFVSEDVLKIRQQKPIVLPPWDPMY